MAKAHTEACQGPACRGPPEARGLPSFHCAPPGALQGTSKDAATHLGSKLPPPPPGTFLCLEAHEVSEAGSTDQGNVTTRWARKWR